MMKKFFGILATLLMAVQSIWAQGTAMNEGALRTLVKDVQSWVKLGTDITLTNGRLDIDGKTVTLDLNGHTLKRPMTAADADGQVIAVMNGGKLTITDSSGDNSGTITGGWSYQGSGIYVYEGCSLTINGGTITGNRSDQIAEGGFGYGGGVENHGTMTITGGNITGNTAGPFGGAIHNEGTLTITGGTIANNTAGTYGGAIYSNSTVGISGATLSGNTAQSGGGAICSEGTLTLDGVTISGNTAQNGGGIYLFGTGTAQLKGESAITSNTAQTGGGIFMTADGATLKMQDKPVVKDNTTDNVHLQSYQLITVSGAFSEGARIGVSTEAEQSAFTAGYSQYNPGVAPSTYFFVSSAVIAGDVVLSGNEAGIQQTGYAYVERGWDAANKKVTETIKTCTSFIPINGNDTSDKGWLPLNDGWYVVTGNSTYKALSVVGTDVHLIIPDGVTLYVNHVKLESGKKLSIYSQSSNAGTLDAINDDISNAAGIGGGEGVSAGHIIIHGGIVQAKGDGNAAGIGGGYKGGFAKEAVNGGLTVYGGEVTANADERGAGIGSGSECETFAGYVMIYGGIVNATGGRCSESDSPWGAGIGGGYVGSGILTHIHGGNVTAISSYGAGIGSGSDLYGGGSRGVNGGEVIIDGGTINASSTQGGAIGGSYESKSATITINGGTVTAKSTSSGVGIGCGRKGESATITINGGNVTATCTGLGVGIGCGMDGKSATITINGGNITASGDNDYGAGIGGGYDANPKLDITITGGTVSASGYNGIGSTRYEDLLQNDQDSNYDGTLTITGGKIYATGTKRAIGGENVANLMTLYDGAMVKAGDTADGAVLFSAGERVQACVNRKYAAIEPCTHTGSVITIDDGLTHHTSCQYCQVGAAGQAETHVFADDGKCLCGLVALKDMADNASVISKWNEQTVPVSLDGRTLYKDGSWNTLCLPFSISDFTGTPLEGATVKALTTTAFAGGTLTLNFSNDLTAIEAGKPYIVKWTAQNPNTVESPVFNNVTISKTTTDVETDEVTFKGIFSPYAISGEDKTILYIDADNKLCYPNAAMTIGACRAYFQLQDGLTAGESSSAGAKSISHIVLNFGDGVATGITNTDFTDGTDEKGAWYDLSGRRLTSKPAQKGIYIYEGKKIVIK